MFLAASGRERWKEPNVHKIVNEKGSMAESGDGNGKGEWGQSSSPGMTCMDFVLKYKSKP